MPGRESARPHQVSRSSAKPHGRGGTPARPQAPATPARLWTPEDVCAFFGISPRTFREWREQVPTFPTPLRLPGRVLRWHPDDVTRWADSRRESYIQ